MQYIEKMKNNKRKNKENVQCKSDKKASKQFRDNRKNRHNFEY